MSFLIKTKPLLQQVIGMQPYSIVAVKGRIFDIELTLDPDEIGGTFYFEFLKEDGERALDKNAYKSDILNKIKLQLLASGMKEDMVEAQALALTNNIYKAILAGTAKQRFEAMSTFASAYELELLPLEEQDGKLFEEEIVSIEPIILEKIISNEIIL